MTKNLSFNIRRKIFQRRSVAILSVMTTSIIGSFVAKAEAATFSLPISPAANATGVTEARNLYDVDGQGVKIGVLSETFDTAQFTSNPPVNNKGQLDNYAFDVAQGYLPSNVQVIADSKTQCY